MKFHIITGLILLSVVFGSSCKKTKIDKGNVTADSMQIQYNGGFAATIDKNYYMIANGMVKEDTTTPFSNKSPDQFDKTLSQDKYDKVKYLLNEVPAQLLKENGSTYNNSTYVDGGSATVIVYYSGSAYKWSFNEDTKGMKDYVKTFADKVFSSVHTLRAD